MFVTLFAQAEQPSGGAGSLLVLLPLILVFYFFMIRPQRQRMRQHQELIRSVQVGDEVETIAGMFGTVQRLSDDFIWVEFAPGTTVKMSRAAVRRKVVEEPPADTETTAE